MKIGDVFADEDDTQKLVPRGPGKRIIVLYDEGGNKVTLPLQDEPMEYITAQDGTEELHFKVSGGFVQYPLEKA
jgi:hypothetical protein